MLFAWTRSKHTHRHTHDEAPQKICHHGNQTPEDVYVLVCVKMGCKDQR
jgi:hypothetical protein